MSEAARDWISTRTLVSEHWQWLGGALCVDTVAPGDLIGAIADGGFDVSC